MLASLAIEAIGWDQRWIGRFGVPNRWRCAEILDTDRRFGFKRRFLRPRVDYSGSNSAGSRGVLLYYELETGHLYEVHAPQTWQRTRHYFCTVDVFGDILELTEPEAMAWLGRQLLRISDRSA